MKRADKILISIIVIALVIIGGIFERGSYSPSTEVFLIPMSIIWIFKKEWKSWME